MCVVAAAGYRPSLRGGCPRGALQSLTEWPQQAWGWVGWAHPEAVVRQGPPRSCGQARSSGLGPVESGSVALDQGRAWTRPGSCTQMPGPPRGADPRALLAVKLPPRAPAVQPSP